MSGTGTKIDSLSGSEIDVQEPVNGTEVLRWPTYRSWVGYLAVLFTSDWNTQDGGFMGKWDVSPVSVLQFDPPQAGAITNIILTFSLSMSLSEYETIEFSLPGFQGPTVSNILSLQGAHGVRFTGVWTSLCPATSLTLLLKKGEYVSAGEELEIIVPFSAGIQLPSHGIRTQNREFTVTTKAIAGPVIRQVIEDFQAVGFFKQSSIDFTPRMLRGVVRIKISFTAEMDLVKADLVMIQLKDVTKGRSCFSVSSNVGDAIAAGNFDIATGILQFQLTNTVPAFKQVDIVIPLAAGITFGFTSALTANSDAFKIMATAAAGDVIPTTIISSPAVGLLDSETLYRDAYREDQQFFQLNFDMSLTSLVNNGDESGSGSGDRMNQSAVLNEGIDCLGGCGGVQGPCTWCGTGMCCRRGWSDKSNGCDGTLGVDGMGHVCVPAPENVQLDKTTIVFSFLITRIVSKGDWVPMDIVGINGSSYEVFDVVSDPVGLFVNGQMRNNGTVVWLNASKEIMPGTLVSVRMEYMQGQSFFTSATIASGCNVTQIEKVMIGLYKSVPDVSACNATSPNLDVSYLSDDLLSKAILAVRTPNSSSPNANVLMYMVRTSRQLLVNDTIRLPVPPYARIFSWPNTSVSVESLGAGRFVRYLIEEDLSYCNASNSTTVKVICQNVTRNSTNRTNGTISTNGTNNTNRTYDTTILQCTNVTTTQVTSSKLLLRVTSAIPAGHVIILAIRANVSVETNKNVTNGNATVPWTDVLNGVRDFVSVQIYNNPPAGVTMRNQLVGKEINMSFSPSMRVVAGEILAVSLPGFTGPERSCIQAVSPFGIFFPRELVCNG